MKHPLPRYAVIVAGCIALLQWVVLFCSNSRLLFHYLMLAPLSAYRQLYPSYGVAAFLLLKGQLILCSLAGIFGLYFRKSFFSVYIQKAEQLYYNREIRLWVLTYAGMFLFALLVRIVYMLMSDNYFNGDTGARLYIGYQWAIKPTLLVGFDWLPMHFYMLGEAIRLTGDVVWAPRMVQVIFGALTVFPFYIVVKHFFPRQIAHVATAFFIIMPLHVQLSVVTLSEVPYVFFILTALALFIQYRSQQRQTEVYLWLSALPLACASLLRYEGWLYAMLFGVLLFFKGPRISVLLRYAVLVSLPVAWFTYSSWLNIGDPLRGLNYSDYEVAQWVKTHHVTRLFNLQPIPRAFSKFAFIFVPIGLVAVFNRKILPYLFLTLIPLSILFIKMFNLTLTGQTRYMLLSAVLIRPLYFAGLWCIIIRFVKSSLIRYSIIFFIGIWSSFYSIRLHLREPLEMDSVGLFPDGFMESALWARNNLPCGSKLFVGNNNSSAFPWIVYSHSKILTDLVEVHDYCGEQAFEAPQPSYYPRYEVTGYVSGRDWVGDELKNEDLLQCLQQNNLDYLVIFSGGEIEKKLHFEKREETWNGYRFTRRADFIGNRIYQYVGRAE